MNELVQQPAGNLVAEPQRELSVEDVLQQVAKIQELTRRAMKRDEHYGVIPGTGDKPTLLKPGAEKISLVFRMVPRYDVERIEHDGGHVTFDVKCSLYRMGTDVFCGEGRGSCSTLESKYRYRQDRTFDVVEHNVPKAFWKDRESYQRRGLSAKKIDGAWKLVRVTGSQRIENPDPADCRNTVYKMACKRAYVAAILAATAASDVFTQDLEDTAEPARAAASTTGQAGGQSTKPAEAGQAGGTKTADNPDQSAAVADAIRKGLDRVRTTQGLDRKRSAIDAANIDDQTKRELHELVDKRAAELGADNEQEAEPAQEELSYW